MAQKRQFGRGEIGTAFNSANTTDVSDTTARAIKAAVAGKRHWITRLTLVNKTAAETPIIQIIDEDANVLYTTRLGGLADHSSFQSIDLDPPIEVAAGKAIQGKATTATGDTIVTAGGYVED